ncbi:MAG: hypothetical protein ABIC40_07290 [bacterium]
MTDTSLSAQLKEALERLGVRVRVEKLEDTPGGFCILEGEKLVIISPDISPSKRTEIYIKALKRLDTSGVWLPPIVRDLLDTNEEPDQI